MKNNNSSFYDFQNEENSYDFVKEFFKYFFFWKYFLFSIVVCIFIAFLINRYTPRVFSTSAKIQILDKKQDNLKMPSAEDLFSATDINLENEIEIIKSSSILTEVIKNLNLNLYVEEVGEIMTSRTLVYPFKIKTKYTSDSSSNFSFNLRIEGNNLKIINLLNDETYFFNNLNTVGKKHDLPFEIFNIKKEEWNSSSYNVNFIKSNSLIEKFKEKIILSQVGKKSDIVEITFNNSNAEYSRNFLNELINVFNNDGIRDRQLIHKRTIDFVNDRFKYIASELESIELEKKSYKVSNSIVDLAENSSISLQRNMLSEASLFDNENQIFLVSNLLNELSTDDFKLLPSNIGIENIEVNSLVNSYNSLFLERQKLNTSAGPNNPFIRQLNRSLDEVRENVIFSLNSYLSQLNILNDKLKDESDLIQRNVANIPSQEKNLRSIERNQQIKETLYLFLLQKGEEAQISFAVTEPSIKVVEYAVTNKNPISPKTEVIFLFAMIFGLFIPFLIVYLIFLFDNKVNTREDLDPKLTIVGEIPSFDLEEKDKVFSNPADRSIVSESSRMLMSNVRYLEKNDSASSVILVTSSIKGEGKTLSALNLALSFSSIGKKVLIIGADLRNPQLHKYMHCEKNLSGLTDYLVNSNVKWKKNIIKPFNNQSLDVLLSGPLPPNPLNLINNGNIELLIKEARKLYDYIIIDTAPTLLVADTKSLFHKSDIILFLVRCQITDKDIVKYISNISKENNNIGIILNGVGERNSYGYSYNYKYSYNYGYGYGYSASDD